MRQMEVKPWNVRKGDIITLIESGYVSRTFRVVVTSVDKYHGFVRKYQKNGKYHFIWTSYQIYHKPVDGGQMPYWWPEWYTKWDSGDWVEIERP